MSSMMVFSFVQKCRVINEFAANLPFKIEDSQFTSKLQIEAVNHGS